MIRPDDLELLRAVADSGLDPEGRAVLATIVATRGSTPRKAGSKMLVRADGSLLGTVGGGCGEAEVLEAAVRVRESGTAVTVRVDLTEDLLSWSPAVCGGIMEILVERVDPVRLDPVDPHAGDAASGAS